MSSSGCGQQTDSPPAAILADTEGSDPMSPRVAQSRSETELLEQPRLFTEIRMSHAAGDPPPAKRSDSSVRPRCLKRISGKLSIEEQ